MTAGEARLAAAEKVREYEKEPGYVGAFFSGSSVGLVDSAPIPASSDVDVCVVFEGDSVPEKPGKLIHRGALLEITLMPFSLIESPERLLQTYELAGSFRVDAVLSDPEGRLRQIQRQVAAAFGDEKWVRLRVQAVLDKIRRGIGGFDTAASYADQVLCWLFPTGITTHGILVAALRNPTVRLRYLRAREVLEDFGLSGFYPELLELLGCSALSPERMEFHLKNLEQVFDCAARVSKTHFPFSADIAALSRPVAIGGSRELIGSGNHREAVFWIACTFARCHKILAADAPELLPEFQPDFEAFIAELGIRSAEDFAARCQKTLDFLPRLEETADRIIEGRVIHG